MALTTTMPPTFPQSDDIENDNGCLPSDSYTLTTLPQEVRDQIYDCIRDDIINNERQNKWYEKPTTDYDALKFTCRQLYAETDERLFLLCKSQDRVSSLLNLPSNKIVLKQARSLSIEIPFAKLPALYKGLASTLDTIQLSLQELLLSFTGKDKHGRLVCSQGCGKLDPSISMVSTDALLLTGQYIEEQLTLLQQLSVLRNLRILSIKNANVPIVTSMVIVNKPHLQALQVVNDPRSVFHFYDMLSPKSPLLQGLTHAPQAKPPPLKVLHIANLSSVESRGMSTGVMRTLEHLTYTVPDDKLKCDSPPTTGLAVATQVVSQIGSRAPNLKVLRLCIDRTISKDEEEHANMIAALKWDLFGTQLESLEIHVRNQSHFFKRELIHCLPRNLRRLYLSDSVLDVNDLILHVTDEFLHLEYVDFRPTFLKRKHKRAVSDTFPESPYEGRPASRDFGIIGETQNRNDKITMKGKLGFVGFEYDDSDHAYRHTSAKDSNRIKLLRMNGRLLDREHNFDLGNRPIPPSWLTISRLDRKAETASFSEHLTIARGLRAMRELEPREDSVKEIISNLERCGLGDDHWYFGEEEDAESIFQGEFVAKIEDQRPRIFPMIAKVEQTHKCQWMAPEYDVPPVGSFPAPPMPKVERYY